MISGFRLVQRRTDVDGLLRVGQLFAAISEYVSIVCLILQFSELRLAKNVLMYHSFKHNCELCGTK